MVHDFSPIIVNLWGDIALRWYGLSYVVGFVCAHFIVKWLADIQRQGLSKEMVDSFITHGVLGVMLGGRLGYCLFYEPELFISFKAGFPFWKVLAVNEGGMSSHGGMIGLVVAVSLFAAKSGVSKLYLYDLIGLTGPLGIFFGRLANFVNGELVGRVAPEGYRWGVKFPQDMFQWQKDSPEKLLGLGDVVPNVGVAKEQWLQWVQNGGANSSPIYDTIDKLLLAIQSGNTQIRDQVAPLLDARYPSQLFAAAGEGLFLFLVLFIFWYKPRRPGMVGALFVTLYALVRIIDEQFRMPDAHIGYQLLNLTRGQWLSFGMFAIGLGLMFVYYRSGSLPAPGWGRGPNVKLSRQASSHQR
jgi:phosphatidylglycerol---prolipoprotein diacylglyceryl transferase